MGSTKPKEAHGRTSTPTAQGPGVLALVRPRLSHTSLPSPCFANNPDTVLRLPLLYSFPASLSKLGGGGAVLAWPPVGAIDPPWRR